MDIIKNPHDALFKRTLTDKDVAKDFLKNYLPGELLNKIDLEEIKIVKDSFIDKDLEESYSDIIYNVKISNREGYIYLLFEHKSYLDNMAPVQLLRYITDIWKLYREQSCGNKLPPIIPILIYHGKKKWDIGSRLFDVIEDVPAEVVKYLPDYKYLVYDFSSYTDEEIKGEIKLRIFIKLISDIFRDNFENGLKQVLPLLNELKGKKTGIDYIETVVKYILNTGGELTWEELNKRVSNISIEGSEIIMTIAERLIQEGMEKGIKEGIKEGMEKGLKEGMEKGKEEGKIEAMREMIEFALELKFGMSGKYLIKEIKEIKEYDKLNKIKNAIKISDSIEELNDII